MRRFLCLLAACLLGVVVCAQDLPNIDNKALKKEAKARDKEARKIQKQALKEQGQDRKDALKQEKAARKQVEKDRTAEQKQAEKDAKAQKKQEQKEIKLAKKQGTALHDPEAPPEKKKGKDKKDAAPAAQSN